ncbi:hypothetical protein ACFQ60_06940 [Streptomyces zhihengii]
MSLLVADTAGEPVVSVNALTLRPVSADALRASTAGHDSLYRIDWVPLAAAEDPGPAAAVLEEASALDDLVARGLPELLVTHADPAADVRRAVGTPWRCSSASSATRAATPPASPWSPGPHARPRGRVGPGQDRADREPGTVLPRRHRRGPARTGGGGERRRHR